MANVKKLGRESQKRNNRAGFLFLLPLIVIFIGLLGYSFYFLIVNSFRDVTITFKNPAFVGMQNYKTIMLDSKFWLSLLNTFLLSAANIFCGLTFGFFIAIILNFKLKGKRFFHALFFIPSMLPIALMAAVFSSMLEYKNGIVNQLLRGVGIDALCTEMACGSGVCHDVCLLRVCFSDRYPYYVLHRRSDYDQRQCAGSRNDGWSKNKASVVFCHLSDVKKYA